MSFFWDPTAESCTAELLGAQAMLIYKELGDEQSAADALKAKSRGLMIWRIFPKCVHTEGFLW